MTESVKQVTENDLLRADIYQLIAALLRHSPNQEMLDFLANLEVNPQDDNPMSQAWVALKTAATQFTPAQLEDEYFSLFIGVGCGEILPYGSWFITGSLMDKPLALLRQDLQQLGFARADDVKEPEDHVAALCEVMAGLILEAPSFRQLAFYQRHISSWIERFCDKLISSPSAVFYASIGQLAKAFFTLEAAEFEQLSLAIPTNCPGTNTQEVQLH